MLAILLAMVTPSCPPRNSAGDGTATLQAETFQLHQRVVGKKYGHRLVRTSESQVLSIWEIFSESIY